MMQQSPILSKSYHQGSEVLIFCVEFWELSHLTLDLSEAEKKITEQMTKMATIFTQNDNFVHFE